MLRRLRRRSLRGAAWIIVFSMLACGWRAPQESSRPVPEGYGWVVLESGDSFLAEIADTPERQQRGFMFREVGPDDAILMVFPIESFHSIWMKNCLSDLDVVWVDGAGTVVHIEEGLPPCEPQGPCPGYGPIRRARYILELPAGGVARHGIAPGSILDFVLRNGD